MNAESIPAPWLAALRRAEELDPILRESLRPVYDRLASDAPDQASSLALAMILRGLRVALPPPGSGVDREAVVRGLAEIAAAYVVANPDHPTETK